MEGLVSLIHGHTSVYPHNSLTQKGKIISKHNVTTTLTMRIAKKRSIVNSKAYPDCSTVNSPEPIRADNSARRFSSSSFLSLLTPLSTELGSRPLEDEHMIVDKPYKPAKTTRSKQRENIYKNY